VWGDCVKHIFLYDVDKDEVNVIEVSDLEEARNYLAGRGRDGIYWELEGEKGHIVLFHLIENSRIRYHGVIL